MLDALTKELKLLSFIESRIGIPFEFGVNDCPLFVAGAIDAMYGTKIREKYTGLWHDKKTAWRYLRKHGGFLKVLRGLGCITIEFPHIQTGDIIVMKRKLAHEKNWHSMAVFTGSKVAIVTDLTGVELIPIDKVPGVYEVLRWR